MKQAKQAKQATVNAAILTTTSVSTLANKLYKQYPVNTRLLYSEYTDNINKYYEQYRDRIVACINYCADNIEALSARFPIGCNDIYTDTTDSIPHYVSTNVLGTREMKPYAIPQLEVTSAIIRSITNTLRQEYNAPNNKHYFTMATWFNKHPVDTSCKTAACLLGTHVITGRIFPTILAEALYLYYKGDSGKMIKVTMQNKYMYIDDSLSEPRMYAVGSISDTSYVAMHYVMGDNLCEAMVSPTVELRLKAATKTGLFTDKFLANNTHLNKISTLKDANNFMRYLSDKLLPSLIEVKPVETSL